MKARRVPHPTSMRTAFLALVFALSTCGSSDADEPKIVKFMSNKPHYFTSETAIIVAEFEGDRARLEPLGIDVVSGTPILLPLLERTTPLRLVVTSGTKSAEQTVLLSVHPRPLGRWCG